MSRERWVRPVERVAKPWGHEDIFALVEGRYCGKAIHVDAGHALSLQYHHSKEETMSVLSGSARLDVGPDESSLDSIDLGPGDSVHVTPGLRHRLTAITDLVVLEASTADPGWRDDVVRLEDRYGREGTSAP